MSRLIDADKLVVDLKEFVENIKNIRDDSKCFLTEENVLSIIDEQPTAYNVDKFKQKLIDKWEKRLSMLDKEYINNLRDKTTIKERKFKKHMKLITRINELEMCIKDLKQLGGEINEDKENR